ncbi:zuotin [Cucumis melo var. makuwa]|uniref:Zuotin n=1 Tax=Cucumis melo var. makuwa TaxID=1194695 RepID=A0A5D3CQ31_CUCMM|nr:zuotin [Cucumis melo var. makuwa]TYK13492.1 zuotin [Cucumis melo var. makuwa]
MKKGFTSRIGGGGPKKKLVSRSVKAGLHPVDCIHWTSAAHLSLLEDEMHRVERVNASSRWEKRQAKVLEKTKVRMMKKKNSDTDDSYWSNLWGRPKDQRNSDISIK